MPSEDLHEIFLNRTKEIESGIVDVWKETPLRFKDFCENPLHMGFPALSDRQYAVADFMFGDEPHKAFDNMHSLAILNWGKGSGKDAIACLVQCYVVYLMLCMRNPQSFFKLPDGESLDLVNVAASEEQAKTVFFEKFKQRIQRWDWLKSKYDVVLSGHTLSHVSEKEKTLLDKVIITMNGVLFPKSIRAFSGHSEMETQEGKNIIFWCCDEVDAFKDKSKSRNAEKIFAMLRSSAVSRFGNRWKGFCLSWPRYRSSPIMRMYEKYKKDLNTYTDRAATWMVKPRHFFDEKEFEFRGQRIPMDFFKEFQDDPTGSMAKYLCEPPDFEQSFIENYDKVQAAVKQYDQLFEFDTRVVNGMVEKTILSYPKTVRTGTSYIITGDLGLTHDPSVISIMHKEGDKVILDCITQWIPDQDRKITVNINNVDKIVNEIRQYLSVAGVFFDRWNSASLLTKLKEQGVRADSVTLTYEDYRNFKAALYTGNIVLLNHEKLIEEIKGLQLISGNKVDHPEDGSNDCVVTVVMGNRILTEVPKMQHGTNLSSEGEFVADNLQSVDFGDERKGSSISSDWENFYGDEDRFIG